MTIKYINNTANVPAASTNTISKINKFKVKVKEPSALPHPDTDKLNYEKIQKVLPKQYKYNEDEILDELAKYIDDTYNEHYSKNKYQATEFILDSGHGTGFTIGNVLKYAQRYGNKGNNDDARKDLFKVLHYAIIAIHNHDLTHKRNT